MTAIRGFVWLVRVAVFLVLLGFAIKNSDLVTLRFFFGVAWELPLVMVMLGFFAVGVLIGLTAALSSRFQQRRQIGRLQREVAATDTGAGR